MWLVAARLKALGLTAYSDNEEKARKKLSGMLQSWIHVHDELGTLEQALGRSGLVTIETRPIPTETATVETTGIPDEQ